MKKSLTKYIMIASLFFLLSSCQSTKTDRDIDFSPDANMDTPMPIFSPSQDKYRLQITTKYGPVLIELFRDRAPNSVDNFLAKAQSGFYNNLTFHRVVPNFVVQGGDPQGTGAGGGKIQSELNNIPFIRGSIGLARTADTSALSNDSQFFICLTDEQCSHLTGEYVNFGRVISGMEFVDQIKQGDLIIDISAHTK